MNYQAFTNDTLTMMYQGARGALAVDDALCELGKECRFRVRETHEWKKHAADLEAELPRRGMICLSTIEWMEFRSLHDDAKVAPEAAAENAIMSVQATNALRALFARAKLL
jgi:hypothetical protein